MMRGFASKNLFDAFNTNKQYIKTNNIEINKYVYTATAGLE
jgi:hypothetical protein